MGPVTQLMRQLNNLLGAEASFSDRQITLPNGTAVKIRWTKGWRGLQKAIKEFDGHVIRAGVFYDSKQPGRHRGRINVATLAAIHEFGAAIPVSQKMRFKLLNKFGVWVDKNTLYIPPRAPVRTTFDRRKRRINQKVLSEARRLVRGEVKPRQAAQNIGDFIVSQMRDVILRGLKPPLNMAFVLRQRQRAERTAALLKGAGVLPRRRPIVPLVNTGSLLNAFEARVHRRK